ncbi:MAG: hypothetical protein J1G01_02470 [Clostridiales bacterium]|nr:hypothetical protein [Clostridiales bacterium]
MLENHVFNNCETAKDGHLQFDDAVNAFERESARALALKFNTSRFELPRTFIIKLLLHIGKIPTGNAFAVVCRVVEVLTDRPDMSFNDVILDFAKCHDCTVDAVTRIIDKFFNMYDNAMVERITSVIQTNPMTARDVICDLAAFTRARYFDGFYQYE